MELLTLYLTIAFINILGWLSPGPTMLAVISASVSNGRSAGILAGLGLSAAAVLWATLAVLGVETLFSLFPELALIIRIAGAGYLLWLGFLSLRRAYINENSRLIIHPARTKKHKLFLRGFLVSASNPKAALFFGSILSAFVPSDASTALLASIVLLCGILSIILHTITATVFSTQTVVSRINTMQRALSAVFGAMFAGLGVGVLYNAIRQR